MPKPSRPYREKPLRHALYQVFVEMPGGKLRAVGPKWSEELAGKLAEDINRAIALGVEKDWGRAHVKLVKHKERPDNRTIGEILLGGF